MKWSQKYYTGGVNYSNMGMTWLLFKCRSDMVGSVLKQHQ